MVGCACVCAKQAMRWRGNNIVFSLESPRKVSTAKFKLATYSHSDSQPLRNAKEYNANKKPSAQDENEQTNEHANEQEKRSDALQPKVNERK